jgi:hypothetical protein
MGTNYYLTWPDRPCDKCGSVTEHKRPVHIGKSSAGWHFGFESTQYKNLDEWKQAIGRCITEGGWIATEYNGDEYARLQPNEFWELVKAKRASTHCATVSKFFGKHEVVCADGVDFCNYSFE